jgi:DNA-binding protein H-NS
LVHDSGRIVLLAPGATDHVLADGALEEPEQRPLGAPRVSAGEIDRRQYGTQLKRRTHKTMPAKFDLDAMSLDALKALQKQLAKAIDCFEDRKKREAMAELEAKARDLGFSLDQLLGLSTKDKRIRAKAGPKYAHPENPEMTWSGRGRKPSWFEEALASGKTAEGMLV